MTKLYLISPPRFELSDFRKELELAFKGGEIPVFQLRMKSESKEGALTEPADNNEIKKAVRELKGLCNDNNCLFILNDEVSLAAELNCDGVHVGVDDMSVVDARKIMGEGKFIGASCYASVDKAFTAGEQGTDYVAFGVFYDTQTKAAKGRAKPELIEFWSKYTVLPSVAIGGIKINNAKPIIDAGADFIAVVTGVWDHEKGADSAVKEFNELFKKCDVAGK